MRQRFVILLLVLLGGLRMGGSAVAAHDVPALPACSGLRWIVNVGSLQRSLQVFPLDQQRQYFDSSCTFLVSGPHVPADYRDWNAVATRSAPALAGVARIVNTASVVVVLYDPESWSMTPRVEQRDPVAAVCRAAAMAHAHDKLLIATPAVDLLRVAEPGAARHGHRYRAFERTGWIGAMAKCADGIEIQAQGAEANPALFETFVDTEARQARAANPHVRVLAGISTNPDGRRVSARQLLDAVRAARADVDGFWLNIPAGGAYCPRCGKPQPRVALQLMQRLGAMPSAASTTNGGAH